MSDPTPNVHVEAISDVLRKLENAPDVKSEEIQAAKDLLQPGAEQKVVLPSELQQDGSGPTAPAPVTVATGDDSRDIRAQIAEMGVPQKIKLAMFGNAVCRAILVMDGSRMIQQFVLKNPKLQAAEIEAFARNPNMSETVLRTISESKTWMKSYSVKLSIVSNPRTPGDIALKWLRYLQDADVKKIARSKNLPQLVVNTAKKRIADTSQK